MNVFGNQFFRPMLQVNDTAHGGQGIALSQKVDSKFLNAEHLLKDFATRRGFDTPLQIFLQPHDKKLATLVDYRTEIENDGRNKEEAAFPMLKWRYPVKLKSYIPTNKNQASACMGFVNTAKINVFEMFEGGVPIIENGMMLNGTFLHRISWRNPDTLVVANQVADTLYLPKHCMEHNLPQPAYIIFLAKGRDHENFERKKDIVISHREEFKKVLGNALPKMNHFKISDRTHNDSIKYRLLCLVFDTDEGKLYVVSDKDTGKTRFAEWVKANLNDLLSANDGGIEAMKKYVGVAGGLLEQLRNPCNGDPTYRPWSKLYEDIGDYKKAVKIWRYAIIQRHLENIERYEANWKQNARIEEILNLFIKIGCNDGRMPGHVKVLGATASKKEFQELFSKENGIYMKKLIFNPHYICGMHGELQKLHLTFQRLGQIHDQERKTPIPGKDTEFEYKRNKEFFEGLVEKVLTQAGPATERLILKDYLPAYLNEELELYAIDLLTGKNSPDAGKSENRKMAEFIYNLFINNDGALRSVVRRGFEVGLLETDQETSLPYMPAASITYKRLDSFFGEDYKKNFTPEQIRSFVIEEVARNTFAKYQKWMSELPAEKRVPMEAWIENTINGQATEIPNVPTAPADFIDMRRNDYILKNWFTPEEVKQLNLEDRLTCDMPA